MQTYPRFLMQEVKSDCVIREYTTRADAQQDLEPGREIGIALVISHQNPT